MARIQIAILSLFLSLFIFSSSTQAARDTNSYDGNIYPIYAGNGSLVPPPNTLEDSIKRSRTAVIVYYLDDSAASKAFAPVVSGIKLLWSSSVDLLPLTIDELDLNNKENPKDPSFYWDGVVPQVVIIDEKGEVTLSKTGQVSIEEINSAISTSTGLEPPSFSISIKSFNEYNSEPSKDGYTDPR